MSIKKSAGLLAIAAVAGFVFAGTAASAAEAVINDPNPIADTVTIDGENYTVARTTVTVPAGVTVDTGSFEWVITASGDTYYMGEAQDDTVPSTSEEEKIYDSVGESDVNDTNDNALMSGEDDILSVGDEDINNVFMLMEDNTYIAKVPAKLDFVVTDAVIELGLNIHMDGHSVYGINEIKNVELRAAE